jgi:CBS domain-containing protein
MARTVADVMTSDPVIVERSESTAEAAHRMAASDVGDVIVLDNGTVCGILTDRDIVVRLVAQRRDPSTPVGEIVSDTDLVTVGPDTSIEQAVGLIRGNAVRRLPVVERGRAVGIVSLGDLAIERDPESALADVSVAEGNT